MRKQMRSRFNKVWVATLQIVVPTRYFANLFLLLEKNFKSFASSRRRFEISQKWKMKSKLLRRKFLIRDGLKGRKKLIVTFVEAIKVIYVAANLLGTRKYVLILICNEVANLRLVWTTDERPQLFTLWKIWEFLLRNSPVKWKSLVKLSLLSAQEIAQKASDAK